MHVERVFTVARPVEAVFDFLCDFTTTHEWHPGTVRTTRTSGDGGVGTTYTHSSELLGGGAELVYETMVRERPTRLQFRGRNASVTTLDSMRFAPAGDGFSSQVRYRVDLDFGRLANLLAPLVLRRRLDRLADETVVRIERALLDRT